MDDAGDGKLMVQHLRVSRLLPVLLCAMVLGACDGLFGPEVICGPLDASECEEAVRKIESALEPQFPGRRVAVIEIVEEDGSAHVWLDDGTEIGWSGTPRQ
jgi:hypothetical protein